MDVFKLFESTVPELQADYTDAKDLRRDELLDNYDAAVKALQCLINAKENELAYRRGIVEMLDHSKTYYDKKLDQANEALEQAKKLIPAETFSQLLMEGAANRMRTSDQSALESTSLSTTPISHGTTPHHHLTPTNPLVSSQSGDQQQTNNSSSAYQATSVKKTDGLDLPPLPPVPTTSDRTSLDNRLTEFLKAYPILSQAGLAAPASSTDNSGNNLMNNSNNTTTSLRPSPGYYTQQPPPPPTSASITAAPPLMAMMRFPPPPMMPTGAGQQPPSLSSLNLASSQENHETADMDLSDHEEPSGKAGLIPMVASAMQQGAGGNKGLARAKEQQASYEYGTSSYNINTQYPTSRMSALPFDPSIMDPTFSSPISSGSSSRDKHSHSNDRGASGSHRHSSGSGSSSKHGSEKKYSSSSSKNKRR